MYELELDDLSRSQFFLYFEKLSFIHDGHASNTFSDVGSVVVIDLAVVVAFVVVVVCTTVTSCAS